MIYSIDVLKATGGVLGNLQSGKMTADQVSAILPYYSDDLATRLKSDKQYRQEELEIEKRIYEIDSEKVEGKINNKIPNDFIGEMVDVKVGYMVGNAVGYSFNGKDHAENAPDTIRRWNKGENVEDLDSETLKSAAICGYAARLLYLEKGLPKVMAIDPWTVAFVGKDFCRPDFAIRILYGIGDTVIGYEVYGEAVMTKYSKGADGSISEFEPAKPHGFEGCPLFGMRNNKEEFSDFKKTLASIEAYDRLFSDFDNELEQMRLAYMALTGEIEDDPAEFRKQIIRTGVIQLPPDGKAGFLEKHLDSAALNSMLDRIEANIMRFAKSVNMTDEQFAGNQSGVALRQKLLAFESKCKTAERKFSSMVRYQYSLLAKYWQKIGETVFNPLDMVLTFTWAVPVNRVEDANILRTLGAPVSRTTAYGMVQSIPDPIEEDKRLLEQKVNDLYATGVDDETATPGAEDEEGEESEEAQPEALARQGSRNR